MFVGGNFRFLCAPTYMSFHTDKICEVPTKILKEIAVFKCENATKKNPRARSHALLAHILTLDFLDVGVLSVACESFIVRGNFIECTGVTN